MANITPLQSKGTLFLEPDEGRPTPRRPSFLRQEGSKTNACDSMLPPGSGCTINLTFTPSKIVLRKAEVSIYYDNRSSARRDSVRDRDIDSDSHVGWPRFVFANRNRKMRSNFLSQLSAEKAHSIKNITAFRSWRSHKKKALSHKTLVGLTLVLMLSWIAKTEDTNPLTGKPGAAKAGEYEFRINCALCHGLGARGGGRGPDLTRAQKKHVRSDAEMFQVISGGISGTAMPANGTNGQGVGMTDEEIWQIVAYIRSVEVKTPAKPQGNAVRGKDLFYGDANCSLCHMVEGKGGRLGPDLSGVGGSRTRDAIFDSVRNPSRRLAWGLTEPTKEFAQEYETITAVTADGKKTKGVALNEDSFTVQIMDADEQIHLLHKDKLQSFEKSRESMMPKYDKALLPDQSLEDIYTYLVSVGTK
jgi:cytochrome c oxidase cbb3-type subunit 3